MVRTHSNLYKKSTKKEVKILQQTHLKEEIFIRLFIDEVYQKHKSSIIKIKYK